MWHCNRLDWALAVKPMTVTVTVTIQVTIVLPIQTTYIVFMDLDSEDIVILLDIYRLYYV